MKWKIKRKKGAYLQVKVGEARIKVERKNGSFDFSYVNGKIPLWQKVQLTAMLINALVIPTKVVVEVVQMFI